MRKVLEFNIDVSQFKRKCLAYSKITDFYAQYENHNIEYPFDPFKNIIAIGMEATIILNQSKNAFQMLQDFHVNKKDWLFGYLSYDLKNGLEDLSSSNIDNKKFPELLFFQAKHVLEFFDKSVKISSLYDPEIVFNEIQSQKLEQKKSNREIPKFKNSLERSEYIETVKKLKNHIYEGDIYEINYCMEYHAEVDELDSSFIAKELWNKSPTPFSCYFKAWKYHIISSSPERFIKKDSEKIISQPIKGTIHSGNSETEKNQNRDLLLNSEKERAENMMIVDLVRNDLAKSSKPGSVKVEELFGIYEFRHILHMISTVTSIQKDGMTFSEIIKNAFPMGSMTGAPKIKVMELIENYEKSKRGVFSGSLGYISPEANFDFNVIIRSLFYNEECHSLSYNIGSAITYDSDPEKEYEECQLKALAIRELF